MHKKTWIAFILFLTACTFEQKNGDLRAIPAPLFAEQSWSISEQLRLPDSGDRICTVSAGEINVTQRFHHGKTQQQIAVSRPLDPGSNYTIIVGRQRYETSGDYFGESQSKAIIEDFRHNSFAYTEWREFTAQEIRAWNRNTNKIPLEGFTQQYDACTQFVHARK